MDEEKEGEKPGADPSTPPATLEAALARIADLETERGTLRKENATHRTKNVSLQADRDQLAEKVKGLEAQQVAGTQNAQALLDSRDAEITTLKTKLTEAETKLGGYGEVEETERKALLEKVPETKREALKTLPLEALRLVVPEIEAQKKESPGAGSSNGRSGATLSLADAAKTKDDAQINAAFEAELAKLDPSYKPPAAPAT